MTVQADDFYFGGLYLAGDTPNPIGSKVTPVTVARLPGLNMLGISLGRIDYVPWGIVNPSHTHLRATEILIVIDGTLEVGFVTSSTWTTVPERRSSPRAMCLFSPSCWIPV